MRNLAEEFPRIDTRIRLRHAVALRDKTGARSRNHAVGEEPALAGKQHHITHDGLVHTAMPYQENVAREQVRKGATNFGDFLTGLGLEISVAPMQPDHLARVSQLTFRTNQFNCTTIRRTEGELRELLSTGLSCHVTHVKDRFGDYGLVGVTLHQISGESLIVDSFMMSCRVLGRGVEHKMVSVLGALASEQGLSWVELRYAKTAKNRPAIEFLESLPETERLQADGVTIFRLAAERARILDCQSFEAAEAVKPPQDVITPAGGETGIAIDVLVRFAMEYPSAAAVIELTKQPRMASNSKSAYQAPRTEAEERLTEIWQEVLRVDRVGINDNFFDLGGDSLLTTHVVQKARDPCDVENAAHNRRPALVAPKGLEALRFAL